MFTEEENNFLNEELILFNYNIEFLYLYPPEDFFEHIECPQIPCKEENPKYNPITTFSSKSVC